MVRRAKKPIDQCAADCANKKFYARHPGDPELFDDAGNWIPLHPTLDEHTEYRKEWMDLYLECGGEIEGGGGKTDPTDPVIPCNDTDVLILVEVWELAVIGPRSELRAVVDSREQYVNLDDKVDAGNFHPEYGRVIRLLARVAWQSGKQSGLAGHIVIWKEGHLDDTRIVDLKKSDHHGFGAPGSRISDHRSVTGSGGWTPVVEFYLSTYGGDVFHLSAALEGGAPIKAGKYQVWKKFWYQVTEMERYEGGRYEMPARTAGKFEEWFHEAFIRFEEKQVGSQRKSVAYQSDIESKDKFGEECFDRDHQSPFKAHLMMVGTFVTGKTLTLNMTMDQPLWKSPVVYRLRRQHGDEKPWLLKARYRPKVRGNWHRWRDLPHKRVRAIRQGEEASWLRYQLEVDFSKAILKPSRKRPVEIELGLGVYELTGFGGGSQHSLISLEMFGTSSTVINNERLGDIVAHEAGHCLGLLNLPPAGPRDHEAWRNIPSQEELDRKPPPDPNAQKYKHCKFEGCLMSYKSLKGKKNGFHYDGSTGVGCLEYLLRQDFSRDAMSFWK
jgi:hypothetical protein